MDGFRGGDTLRGLGGNDFLIGKGGFDKADGGQGRAPSPRTRSRARRFLAPDHPGGDLEAEPLVLGSASRTRTSGRRARTDSGWRRW